MSMGGIRFVLGEVLDPWGDRDRTFLCQEATRVLESGSWVWGR